MPQYRIRLESQTDDQWREMTVAGPDVQFARAVALRAEQERVDFTLAPQIPVEPKKPGKDADANVLMDYLAASETYARSVDWANEALERGYDLLKTLTDAHHVDKDGKAHGPTRVGRGHLHTHLQKVPYEIKRIDVIKPEVGGLVQQMREFYEQDAKGWQDVIDRMREDGIPTNVVTGTLFGLTAQKQIDGSSPFVWTTATVKVALTTSSFTPAQDTHDFFNDVTNEVSGTGYSAGGATLATPTSTYDTATDQIRLDAADTSWSTSTITARDAVIWIDTAGASSTDPVVGWVDFGADVSTTAGTFQITWDALGIVNYDVT